MSNRILRFMAVVVAVTLLLSTAVPSMALAKSDAANAPGSVTFDVIVLRPLGFATLAVGTGIFLGSLPLLLVTRPKDIAKPANVLITRPARYLWKDSLGSH